MFRRCSIILLLLMLPFFIVRTGRLDSRRSARAQTDVSDGITKESATNGPAISKNGAKGGPSSNVPTTEERRAAGVKQAIPLQGSYALFSENRENFHSYVDENGIERRYRPEVVLARFKNDPRVFALKVKDGTEREMQQKFSTDPGFEYAELDAVMTRQFLPDDQEITNQWHHATIHSSAAWDVSLGNSSVTIAILDTPFQMDHPDLAAHAATGWDMVSSNAITTEAFRQFFAKAGYVYHSTIGGGLACAVINNFIGVAGVANCQLMPINIGESPTLSDMYKAVLWAADHEIRVVNLSWDGAYSSVVNDGAGYLKDKTRGMLFMAGVNGIKYLDYPNQPNIYAISMTDTTDTSRSAYGPHIDFAAPGYEIYSTTTNSGYEFDSGSSYSCPLAAGMAAFVMSVNPALGPNEILDLMKASTIDLGPEGWDQYYGWGRLDFGKLALAAFATLPVSHIAASNENFFSVQANYMPGADYQFFRSSSLSPPNWQLVSDFSIETNGPALLFRDLSPPAGVGYYELKIKLP